MPDNPFEHLTQLDRESAGKDLLSAARMAEILNSTQPLVDIRRHWRIRPFNPFVNVCNHCETCKTRISGNKIRCLKCQEKFLENSFRASALAYRLVKPAREELVLT